MRNSNYKNKKMVMEVKNVNSESVKEFWKWFSTNHQHFGGSFENVFLLQELDTRVTHLGNFSWEVGPGQKKENQLVISPNGDANILSITKEIVRLAPEISNWEFYYAKPPKNWNFNFEFLTDQNGEIVIDASKWKYVLLRYPDSTFEIIIQMPEFEMLREDEQLMAAEIFLDSIIGEEARIKSINGIEVVQRFSQEFAGKESNATNLGSHFKDLLS